MARRCGSIGPTHPRPLPSREGRASYFDDERRALVSPSEGQALMVDSDSVVVAGSGEPLAEMGVAPSANVQAVAQ
ncbi:MAG: hypothetical protein DI640_09030 [Sphingomonas taxi]|uniref:Uncharacterized protein n=1 Tax=Sphingomonas taxi TaxID=1549858 RepID=A0A2W4YV68_9SPHN|nr:MAG: hypothetical protein DI640_09030 [Sphingomonas taxi]